MMDNLKNKKYEGLSFLEALLAIVFLGLVGVVLARFSSTTMSKLIRDEKVEEATSYAVNSDVEIQSIVNKKVVDKESDKELSGEAQVKEEIFPETAKCNGYFYIVKDDDNNPILARDADGNVLCAYGYEQGEEAVRENCVNEDHPAYKYCVVKDEKNNAEFFRYIHINFPADYSFDETDFLLADITVGQLINQDGKVTSKNMISDYKYHTALKLTDVDTEHTVKLTLNGATVNGEKYIEDVVENNNTVKYKMSVTQYNKKVKCDLSCRGEAKTSLDGNDIHIEDILSDVDCTLDCIEDPCANYDLARDCGNGVVECEEECDPPGVDNCSDVCKYLCGDGKLDKGEVCERNNPDGVQYDWDDALCDHKTCKTACDIYTLEYCGNGKVEEECGEKCDPAIDSDCSDMCEPFCGNGIIEKGEDCEDGNPSQAKLKWEDPFCVKSKCKECKISGTVKITNGNPPTSRKLTPEEISTGRVYLDAVDISEDVLVNGKKFKDLKYDDAKKSYYIDLIPYCENNVKVDITIEYKIVTGTLITNNSSKSKADYDIFMVLDVSGSMKFASSRGSRLSRASVFADAVNNVLKTFIDNTNNRLGYVVFSDSTSNSNTMYTYLNFGNYNSGTSGSFLYLQDSIHYKYLLYDSSGKSSTREIELKGGTNTQHGLIASRMMMENVKDTENRIPVYIIVTDGESNFANTDYINGLGKSLGNGSRSTEDVLFYTMSSAKYAKEQASKKYGVDAFFFSMVILPNEQGVEQELPFIELALAPSPTTIRNFYKNGKGCNLVKSIISGSWSACTHSERSSGGLDLDKIKDDDLNKYNYSDGLYIGSDMTTIKNSLLDIINIISKVTKRDLTLQELKDKKVYLEDIDSSKNIKINGKEYSFSDAEKNNILVKDNKKYYVDLTPYINNKIEIEYTAL